MYHKMEKSSKMNLSHHNQLKYCTNRPKYRDGQRLTAVKVNKTKCWHTMSIYHFNYLNGIVFFISIWF